MISTKVLLKPLPLLHQIMLKSLLTLFLTSFILFQGFAQRDFFSYKIFSMADTLRGMLRQERTCYDVTYYDINLSVVPKKKFIKGYVDIHFNVMEDCSKIQIDLFENMAIDSIVLEAKTLKYYRIYNAVIVQFDQELKQGTTNKMTVYYQGKPQIAKNPPWEGGFVWKKDKTLKPWIGVACEGIGASLWWPCKDHLSDEPDSVSIKVTVPSPLVAVCNGNLKEVVQLDNNTSRYHWFVSYPINTYNVTLNIGQYEHFNDWYYCEDGDSISLDYYVLPHHFELAKTYFKQVKPVLASYERYFGKFPFPKDGYGLVETPYVGMEHQGAIAYGNAFKQGSLKNEPLPANFYFDYIIVHETAHEYFGNAISVKDLADIWIHEGFATYMEALYVEQISTTEDAIRYINRKAGSIDNIEPIVGPHDVNYNGAFASDYYDKGAYLLHTIRVSISNDEKFFGMLKGFYDEYKYKTCTSEDFVKYTSAYLRKDMTRIFEQYLHYPSVPTLEYSLEKTDSGDLKIKCRWIADVEGFDLHVVVGTATKAFILMPSTKEVKEAVLNGIKNVDDFTISEGLFYVIKKNL